MATSDLESLLGSLTPSTGTSLIKAVRSESIAKGANTLQLIALLDKTFSGFETTGRRICGATRRPSPEDREMLTLYGRILAASIILLQKVNSSKELRRKTLLLLEYGSALVRTKYDFLTTALDVVTYPITGTGLDWKLIEDATSLDIISYRLIEDITFDRSKPEPLSFTGKGKALCRGGVLTVCSSDAEESGAKAFGVCGDRVEVITRNNRDEKLKASDQYDVEALGEFAETFCKSQDVYTAPRAKKRTYAEGDRVDICITGLSEDESTLLARVVDLDTDIQGEINNETLIAGVETGDLIPYLFEDDCIRGAILHRDEKGWFFSIAEAFTRFSKAAAEADYRGNVVFLAKAVAVWQEWGRITWLTPSGYFGLSRLEVSPEVKVGDTAIKQVINIQTKNKDTYINVDSPKFSYETLQRMESEESVLERFVTDTATIYREEKAAKAPKEDKTAKETIQILSSILFSTARRGSTIDAYRHLLVSLFLAKVTGDKEAFEAIRNEAFFLRGCLTFAEGGRLPGVYPDGLLPDEVAILGLLSQWDEEKGNLLEQATTFPSGSLPGEIAALLLGLRISALYQDEVKASPEAIRRRICALLGVEDSYEAGRAERRGKYGKTEGHEVEFKSSYVFRNDNSRPDIDYQGRGQVFEAVCGFLNAGGGVLYLGVNNDGDPIIYKDSGLGADMAWLTANYKTINGQRTRQLGHPVCKADNLDHYVLFLNNEKELYFKESLQGNITIEVTEDADAIMISVAPSEYEIAYLYSDRDHKDGVAYVRDGGQTVVMSRVQKERRLASLKRVTKEVGFVVTIQEAIDQRRKLIFKNYASGNSGRIKDRFVVPVNLFYNDENVYCYDLEARMYKQFRLHRIGSIETDIDNPVYTLPLEAPKKADVFRWLDEDESYHIKLRLEVGAKNYLFEEYSCAQNLPIEELYPDGDGHWILETRVNGLGGVRRFYLGLADKIEILDTEDSDILKEEIKRFVEENMML